MSSTRPDLKFTDNSDERSYFRKYNQLPPKDVNTIRVIDHNNKDYFTVLDSDADLIADNIYRTQSVIKFNNKNKYVTISYQVFINDVLKFCLIDKHLKVEIYNNKTFQLITTATAGNLDNISQEYGVNLEFQDYSSSIIAGVKFQQTGINKKVGVCLIDISNSSIQVSEFDDNELYSNLESLLLQLGVKEVVLPSNYNPQEENADMIKLFQVLDRIGNIVTSSVKSSLFNHKDIEQDLSKLITNEVDDNVGEQQGEVNVALVLASKGISTTEFPISLACCNALVAYLDLLGEDANKTFSIEQYNLTSYMKLDSSTMRALNIFPQTPSGPMGFNKSKNVSSIFELLNDCKTAAGSRLLSQWLKQPLTNLTMIEERQALVNLLMDNTTLRVFTSNEFLSRIPDIKRLVKKVATNINKTTGNENKKLEDVVSLYQIVLALPDVIDVLSNTIEGMKGEENQAQIITQIEKYWLAPIQKSYESLRKFQELVETTVDLSPLESSSAHDILHNDYNIRPEFDESLVEINERIQNSLSEIKQLHIDVADDLNMELDKKLKLEKHIQHGWCFRVTRNDSVVLRNKGKKYNELQTVKAGVYFTCRELSQVSQTYLDAFGEYNKKQRELIKEVLAITLTYQSVFQSNSNTERVNLQNRRKRLHAILAPTSFVKPKLYPLSDSIDSVEFKQRKLKLEDARHPVLEVQDDINFIANDIYLSNDREEKGKPFVIITGPNMGGKSTYIRQIGVIALMSQIGSFIPASEDNFIPEIPIFDAILSRVGAGDSQLKGLSTFMIEMLETASILATATHNSLIIIDELGRGTSTYDGFGLAWSISEHLITSKQCFALFATHFHELNQLSQKYPDKVENLHVVAHLEKGSNDKEEDDITLMYKVEPGISDKSFGIHVAELVKFPTKIINMAKRKASELQEEKQDDPDVYIQSKRTKCSPEEIGVGIEKLKAILKKWKSECYDGSKCKYDSQTSVSRLREILVQESESVQSDKLIAEITSLL
ncbi:MSH2 [[Candida] subhashii]|uniref:MSH2 n=1 Tax=[Candida] subhashii TaxID=561895 RepID=A0A8J5UN47_9ASCO|nr:MSH2 [[Candida] subhashii]KAG7666408.1 MSH2 [[Candida] subhashii]